MRKVVATDIAALNNFGYEVLSYKKKYNFYYVVSCQLKPSGVAIAPLVGSIACGQPVDAVENIEESFALPRSIFGNGDLFMIRTFGDSMIDIGIKKDDLVPCT